MLESVKILQEQSVSSDDEEFKGLDDYVSDLEQAVNAFDPDGELPIVLDEASDICSLTQVVHLETGLRFPKMNATTKKILRLMGTFRDGVDQMLQHREDELEGADKENILLWRTHVENRRSSIEARCRGLEEAKRRMRA